MRNASSVAIYKRVSSKAQDTKSQALDLDAHRKQLASKGDAVVEYTDKFTGKTMNRPGWQRLWADVEAGKVTKIVVWRLDRLGRTVSGLSRLFEELVERKVPLVSLKDGLDLSTPAGRLMANVLASVAAYEIEVKLERQLAGMAAARRDIKAGKRQWFLKGKPQRRPWKLPKLARSVVALHRDAVPIAQIAKQLGLSRPSIYKVLNGQDGGNGKGGVTLGQEAK